jgi:hypothetical protein
VNTTVTHTSSYPDVAVVASGGAGATAEFLTVTLAAGKVYGGMMYVPMTGADPQFDVVFSGTGSGYYLVGGSVWSLGDGCPCRPAEAAGLANAVVLVGGASGGTATFRMLSADGSAVGTVAGGHLNLDQGFP